MTLTPTPEQAAIIDAAKQSKDNLLISALAGAAKTSTLVMVANAKVEPTLSLAFNKKIAEEMTKRLPSHCASATLNSVGHRTWSAHIGKRLVVAADKTRTLFKEAVDNRNGRARGEAWEGYANTLKLVSTMKIAGFNPVAGAKTLISEEDFFDGLEEEPEDIERELAVEVLKAGIKSAFAGTIDFDDQIYMPTMFGAKFPQYPLVLVDEAQDLSPLNHAMLRELGRNRVIAVGDAHQSIYGFRGAMSNSMSELRSSFNMQELPLSVSFRCPSEIVLKAREHAPHMQWHTEGGSVHYLGTWNASSIPDGAVIICRNNAPLLKCAFALIKEGRGVKVAGSDIGPQLLKALRKLGDESMTVAQCDTAIDSWLSERLKKSRAPAGAHDRAECLRVLVEQGGGLAGAIAYTERLFNEAGPILLMSGHKAKGLEFDVVFHLDSWRIPSKWSKSADELQQESNVSYVITTRSKDQLYHINLEDFRP